MPEQLVHICNSGTFRRSGWRTITSQAELDTLGAENNIVLLNIHLNWDGRALSGDYGFEIANYLRTKKKYLGSIIFYSPIPVGFFETKSNKNLKYKLLFGRGSAFVEAPFTKEVLEGVGQRTPPLTPSSLHDVVTMLADVKGAVLDKLNHDLRLGADLEVVFDEVGTFLSERQKALIQYNEFVERLLAADDEAKFHEIRDAFLGVCNNVLTEAGGGKPVEAGNSRILVLDDRDEDLQLAVNNLQGRFVVDRVSQASEAIHLLENDFANEILGVVADWRLYDDKPPYWQSYQGYEVLERAASTGHRALFALTSQADFVVHQIRNLMGVRFHLVKKQNLRTKEQWDLFADVIQAGCADAQAIISEIPSSKTWFKPVNGISYRELYLGANSRVDSMDFFRSVEDKARLVWDYIEEASKLDFKDIKLIKDQFGLEVPRKNLNLATVLVLRLVWLRLWHEIESGTIKRLNEEDDDQLLQVFRILCKGYWRGYIDRSDALVELNKVALSIKDIQQKKMLPHERSWLVENHVLEA